MISSNFRGLALDGATRYGAFPETRLSQVRPTRGLAMSCPLICALLVFFHMSFSLSLSLSLSAAVRRVYPLCKRWRPTPLALDMATLAERFKSSVRVIKRRVDRSNNHRFARSFVFYGDLRLRSFAKSENSRYEIRLWIGMDRSWSFVVVSAFWYLWNRMISYRWIRCTLQESGSWKVANVVYNILYFTFR